MRWPTRVLLLPLAALRSLRSFIQARAGVGSDVGLRCLACNKRTTQCMCLAGPQLEEQLDQSTRPTVRKSSRAEAMVPGPPKVPHEFKGKP